MFPVFFVVAEVCDVEDVGAHAVDHVLLAVVLVVVAQVEKPHHELDVVDVEVFQRRELVAGLLDVVGLRLVELQRDFDRRLVMEVAFVRGGLRLWWHTWAASGLAKWVCWGKLVLIFCLFIFC